MNNYHNEFMDAKITVLEGIGYGIDKDSNKIKLISIFLPFTDNGKHYAVEVYDEERDENISQWMNYLELKIIDFKIKKIKHL